MTGQRLLERAGDDAFFTDLNACNTFTNGAELATRITVETLVVIGNQDPDDGSGERAQGGSDNPQ